MASHQYPGHKPTMTEKVKLKVDEMKEKVTGHPTSGPSTTTPPATAPPRKEGMMEKVKEKLPGHHGTGHPKTQTGATGYGLSGTPGYGAQSGTAGYGAQSGTTGHGTTGAGTHGHGHEPTIGEKIVNKVTHGGNTRGQHGSLDSVTPGHENTSGYTGHQQHQGIGGKIRETVMPGHQNANTHNTTVPPDGPTGVPY